MIKAAVGILLLLPICVLEVRAQISPHHNYIKEELTIKISDSISLSGVLTTPLNSNSRLLIILVGPPLRHVRDYTTKNASRKEVEALSDEFTSKGRSAFRFDNRD